MKRFSIHGCGCMDMSRDVSGMFLYTLTDASIKLGVRSVAFWSTSFAPHVRQCVVFYCC